MMREMYGEIDGDDIGLEQLEILIGYANAIRDNETTIDEVFNKVEDAPKTAAEMFTKSGVKPADDSNPDLNPQKPAAAPARRWPRGPRPRRHCSCKSGHPGRAPSG